ncbi:MAG: flagellar hook-basal body complex protein [Thermodesulfobacteriota bacterium]|nr:flagellar hook-basal body complex protein [Thermodesulfobacteriota bacterium]
MSLSSSLYTGTSGLTNMGNAMQVVGNNISNVNTVGFKKGRSTFADTLSENVATQAGTAQVGRGMSMESVDQAFGTGSFESTGNSTDLSIGGDGFFVLRQSGSENNFYTRAGNFHFDKTGQLINPEGYIVQGWKLDDETGDDTGSIKDIVLDAFTSPPKKSSTMTAITNLDADAESKAVVLSNLWDSSAEDYIGSGNYEYQTVVKVYDSLGSTHDITIHYDKKSGTDWEYTVSCNPDEDKRELVQGTTSEGLLARGTITFSQSSGDILDFTMSKMTGRIGNLDTNGVNTNDATHFTVDNYDAMALDGYNFSFEFNGTTWDWQDINGDAVINGDDLPTNYKNATILYSDSQSIEIALNADDTDADLKISFDQPAVATDSLTFDINNKNDLHVQGVENTTYFGETANDNTSLQINDPSVMTTDAEDIGMVWYPVDKQWRWSNPEAAKDNGTLVSGMSCMNAGAPVLNVDGNADGTWDYTDYTDHSATGGAIDEIIVTDADKMPRYSDIQVQYDTGAWHWDNPVKDADFGATAGTLTSWSAPFDSPSLSSIDNSPAVPITGNAFDAAGDYTLTYTAATTGPVVPSSWALTLPGGGAGVAAGDDSGVSFTLDNGTTAKYSFGSNLGAAQDGGTITFTIDPSAPVEYPDAVIIPDVVNTEDLDIDFNNDSSINLEFDMDGAAAAAGNIFTFTVDPDTPPAEYASATLKGDQESAVIDLDGSGNENDDDDIVFLFDDPLKYGSGAAPYTDRSEISFNIDGSTAWQAVTEDEIKKEGYYSFTADFLGGEKGLTEMDIQFNIGAQYDGANWINDSMSSTQYSRSSSTTFQSANGYSAGDLQGVDVASDGVMTGIYSNGELMPLFRVGLAKFLNNQGLQNSGGNLFRETRDSGEAITNKPGENGLGTIAPNSLEMSNVDISEEFVKMISTQRGFQANSKTITTVDDMMSTVIQMKR